MGLNLPSLPAGHVPTATEYKQLTDAITQAYGSWVRKTVDETVNNSTTLQADDELFLSLAANGSFVFELVVGYSSGTTPDFKIGWTLPAGATNTFQYDVFDTALNRTLGYQSTIPSSGIALGGNASDAPAYFRGSIVTGSTAGTWQVLWAQNTANATDTIVRAGSYMRLTQVA